MLKKTYVIADIHGYSKNLIRLLNLLTNNHKLYNIKFIFIGDYIDDGPNSLSVINYLIKFQKVYNCIFLRGNHEYKFIVKDIDFFRKYGGILTAKSYLGDNVSNIDLKTFDRLTYVMNKKKHIKFINKTKDFTYFRNFYISHAGYNPNYKKLDDVLLNDKESLFFFRNKLMNNHELLEGRKIIFGHVAFKNGYKDNYKVGINWGVNKGGKLAAYCIETEQFILDDGCFFDSCKSSNEIK